MIRKILQFETVSQVVARGTILVLLIAIAAGLTVEWVIDSYFAGDTAKFAASAYLVGAFTGIVVAAPIVFAFFFAAKEIYGVTLHVVKIASEDFLTGLLNRREFFSRITSPGNEQGSPHLFSREGLLLIIDADNFKQINDTYGHPVGDKALIRMAAAIKNSVREQDIVSRIGGEEFAVLLPSVSIETGAEIAERIRTSVEAIELFISDTQIVLTVSTGAVFVTRTALFSSAMKAADSALYRAKQSGKNCVVIDSSAAASIGDERRAA
jgi:diguanylate cyclase